MDWGFCGRVSTCDHVTFVDRSTLLEGKQDTDI